MGEQLTQEQKELVEKNHNLIYGFMKLYSLDAEEYYGLCAIGLCYAAIHYDINRGCFSNFAYIVMKSLLCKQIISPSVALDELTALEVIDDTYMYDKVIEYEYIKHFKMLLSCKDQMIFDMLLMGMTQKEIAKNLGVTYQRVSQIVQRIRRTLNPLKKKWENIEDR